MKVVNIGLEYLILKNRRINDILILYVGGLSRMNKTIDVAFPKTKYQHCVAHQVRNI